VPRGSRFRLVVVLGVQKGNLYKMRFQPMSDVTSNIREIDEEEKVAP
jgi:hypothetical protein